MLIVFSSSDAIECCRFKRLYMCEGSLAGLEHVNELVAQRSCSHRICSRDDLSVDGDVAHLLPSCADHLGALDCKGRLNLVGDRAPFRISTSFSSASDQEVSLCPFYANPGELGAYLVGGSAYGPWQIVAARRS